MNTEVAVEQTAFAEAESLFVTVPETKLPSGLVVPSFLVGRYHVAKSPDGTPVIDPQLAPWTEINFADAKAQCEAMGGELIRETQALALAWNVFNVAENWSGGAVGEGTLLMGLHDDDDLDAAPAGTYAHADISQRRGFKLSNGETVFDVAGCVYSWVFDDLQGDADGLVARAFTADSPSIANIQYPSMEKGMGWYPPAGRDWSGYALLRGGCWYSSEFAGVFSLSFDWPDGEFGFVGFRCTKPIGV